MSLGFGVEGSGFRVYGVGLWVRAGFGTSAFAFQSQGVEFKPWGVLAWWLI